MTQLDYIGNLRMGKKEIEMLNKTEPEKNLLWKPERLRKA